MDRCSNLAAVTVGGLNTAASRWRISGTVKEIGSLLRAEVVPVGGRTDGEGGQKGQGEHGEGDVPVP